MRRRVHDGTTTTAFYIKPSREEAVNGMRLVEKCLEEKLSGMLKLSKQLVCRQVTNGKG